MSLSIIGTGSALPSRVLTNDELATFLDTSNEWIKTRTGIERRHILAQDETLTDLAAKAAQRAMQSAGVTSDEIDYVLCATLGGDYITPSLACMVQGAIKAKCPAVDLNAACSGFLYALDIAAGLFCAKRAKKILLVTAEALSRVTNWEDRSTAVLFGDAAAALVLQPGDELKYLHLTSAGDAVSLNAPNQSANLPGYPEGKKTKFYMDGGEIYKFAVNAICTGVQEALNACGITMEDVNHVLMHQANRRILDAACKRFNIPKEKCPIAINEVGNVSAVSLPLLMDRLNSENAIKKGDTLVLSAFGAGLTTGTAVLRW